MDSSLRLMLNDIPSNPYETAKRDSMLLETMGIMDDGSMMIKKDLSLTRASKLIKNCTALDHITKSDKILLWTHRHFLASLGTARCAVIGCSTLPAVLRSVDWTNSIHVEEIHHLLYRWVRNKKYKVQIKKVLLY